MNLKMYSMKIATMKQKMYGIKNESKNVQYENHKYDYEGMKI